MATRLLGRLGQAFALLLAQALVSLSFVVPAAQAAEAAQDRALTAAYNASGHDLFMRFADRPGNIVFSPYSIGTAMAMALVGARGETEREMATVLKQSLDRTGIAAANRAVLATLNGYDRSAAPVACPASMQFDGTRCTGPLPTDGRCRAGYEEGARCVAPGDRPPSAALRAANALMLLERKGDVIAAPYISLLEGDFAAQVFRDATLDEINRWVSGRTEGKIDKILDQIDPAEAAVILNAVYFKAAWQAPFSRTATRDADFRLASAATIKVPTMHRIGRYPVLVRPGFRAIRLPYSVNALSMVLVVPNDVGGADKLGRDLDADALAALFRDLTESKTVDLALPRFKTSFKAELGALFKQAGMRRAFDGKLADFSGMTGRPPAQARLSIAEVVHRAMIDVTEEGIEAAAATAVAMTTASLPAQVEPFAVDRPFLFYVVDAATGAILFQGRVSDPRQP